MDRHEDFFAFQTFKLWSFEAEMRYSPRAQTMISLIQSVWCSIVSKYGLSFTVSLIDHLRIIESRPAVYSFELNGHHRIAFTPEYVGFTRIYISVYPPSNLPARCPDSSASRIWNEICVLPTGRSRPRVISSSREHNYLPTTMQKSTRHNFEVFRTVFIIRKLTNSKVLTFLVLGDLSGTSDETSSSGCNKTDLLTRRCVTSDS